MVEPAVVTAVAPPASPPTDHGPAGAWRIRLRDLDDADVLFESDEGAFVASSERRCLRFGVEISAHDEGKAPARDTAARHRPRAAPGSAPDGLVFRSAVDDGIPPHAAARAVRRLCEWPRPADVILNSARPGAITNRMVPPQGVDRPNDEVSR